jgi:hypothetical protein
VGRRSDHGSLSVGWLDGNVAVISAAARGQAAHMRCGSRADVIATIHYPLALSEDLHETDSQIERLGRRVVVT